MARTTKAKNTQPLTTAQRLGIHRQVRRDIMRKDKGLNGDLDRLPMLTWIMFLKFLDDLEQIAEEEAKLAGKTLPPGDRAAVSLARLGGQSRRHHRRRADRLHQQRGSRPARRQARARACSPICAACKAPTAATGAT